MDGWGEGGGGGLCGVLGGFEKISKINSQGGWKYLENLIAGGDWNFVFCFFFNHKNYLL